MCAAMGYIDKKAAMQTHATLVTPSPCLNHLHLTMILPDMLSPTGETRFCFMIVLPALFAIFYRKCSQVMVGR